MPSVQETISNPETALAAVACPYCRTGSSYFLSSYDRNRQTTTEVFQYYRCHGCGLIFMESPPADMTPYYQGGYDPIPSSAANLRAIAAAEKFRTESVLKYKSAGCCLEIGPWRGVICSNMKDAGFDVTAIEMDVNCVNFLRDQLGIQAIQSTDPACTMEVLPPCFDVAASIRDHDCR